MSSSYTIVEVSTRSGSAYGRARSEESSIRQKVEGKKICRQTADCKCQAEIAVRSACGEAELGMRAEGEPGLPEAQHPLPAA